MIYSALSGGLGNQMFQYAFARHISSSLKQELVIDTKWYKNRKDRSLKLHYFDIHARFGFTKSELLYHVFHDITIPAVRQLKRVLPRALYSPDYFILQKHFEFYDDYWNCIKPGVCLAGLWQSEKFFAPSAELIRKDFTLKADLFELALIEKSKELKNSNSVMIHVRRGDYLNMSTYRILGKDYYIKAIKTMLGLVEKPFLYIFSDDRTWCKEHLLAEVESMSVPYQLIDFTKSDMEDFMLMSNCNHSIISNSTFSWWAAWLNNNSDKKIISPDIWFASEEYKETDIIPAGWIKI